MQTDHERRAGRRGRLGRAAFVAALVPGFVTLPVGSFAAGPEPEPVSPEIVSIPLDDLLVESGAGVERRTPQGSESAEDDPASALTTSAATAPIAVEPFVVGGVTWAPGSDPASIDIEFRTRSSHGWSTWTDLPAGSEHAPDPGSVEGDAARPGTDPLVVAGADAVQVRISTARGGKPRDLRLELVDPGSAPADRSIGTQPAGAAAAAPARPTIYTRAQWGADESLREAGPPDYGRVRGAFVHHTAGTNSYSSSQVPAIIRGIYAYHVNGRGWRDIGYNFLVDRFGRIWEGRYGGINRAVVGAHTAGYNSNAFAMSVLGTYTSKEPEAAVIASYKQLFAWKFVLHGVIPSIAVAYPGGKTLQPVAGHRNTKATECPGAQLYAEIPEIRAGTTARMVPLPATRPSTIRATGPASAARGTLVTLRVYWSSGTWVTGIANLQRWSNGSWRYVRQVHVNNGRGSARTVLDRTGTYRVYGRKAPGLILPVSANLRVVAR